jgi:hypothetical protein
MTNRNRILASLGVLVLCCVFGASQALAASINISGKLFTLATPAVPVGGATVSVYPALSPSTTTAGDGSWTLTGVSDLSDPVLKIGATATTVETYTTYPLTLLKTYQTSPLQYDISAVRTADYVGVPPGACLILGFAVQFTDLVYPNAYTPVSGVVVTSSGGGAEVLYFAYVKPDGSPCPPPLCNATTSIGGWIGVATPPTNLKYSGTLTVGGSCSAPPPLVFSGGDVECVADTANITGLVHPTLP